MASELRVDVINEQTQGVGVTVNGVKITDDLLSPDLSSYETIEKSVADDAETLESAKNYTDGQISGLDIPLVARGTFGSTSGDLPATGLEGDAYWCEEDNYLSVVGGFTAMRADMVIWTTDVGVRSATYSAAAWRLIPATDPEFANKTLNEIITGAWSFDSSISASTAPSSNAHLTNKLYVDTSDTVLQGKIDDLSDLENSDVMILKTQITDLEDLESLDVENLNFTKKYLRLGKSPMLMMLLFYQTLKLILMER